MTRRDHDSPEVRAASDGGAYGNHQVEPIELAQNPHTRGRWRIVARAVAAACTVVAALIGVCIGEWAVSDRSRSDGWATASGREMSISLPRSFVVTTDPDDYAEAQAGVGASERGSDGVAVRTSRPASSAAAREATSATRVATPAAISPAASPATPPIAPGRMPHEERTPPPKPLAPRPPADGRDAPDPFLLEDGDRWVLYSTQVGLANVPVAATVDLASWSAPTDALPELPTWAEWGRTWAPGVLPRPGGFVLYFAARCRATGGQCIGAATSTSATGPFTSTNPEPLVCQPELGGSIDPHPFVDTDGTAYLLWKADGNAIGRSSALLSQRLRPDGLALEGQATPLLHNDAAWEAPLIENPALVRVGGRYVLLYSGGWWESAGYATGYATCDSPLGPCEKVTTEHPLHASGGGVAGPGGACVITGPAGDMWLAHHGWTQGAVGYRSGGARSLHFTALHWDGTRLDVHGSTAGQSTSM